MASPFQSSSPNQFFTIMIVPEKTQNVRKIIVPSYLFKGGMIALVVMGLLAAVMVLDYANVMSQISETRQLKTENRQLKQQVQVFKDKMVSIEGTLDRVKTFATKLRIITNIEDRSSGAPPRSASPAPPLLPGPSLPPETDQTSHTPSEIKGSDLSLNQLPGEDDEGSSQLNIKRLLEDELELPPSFDTEVSVYAQAEFSRLDRGYKVLSHELNQQEQEIQDIYERLSDKRSMLMSMPTRIPTDGYITSGFGVRFAPYGGRKKMHEGIDIANRYGADIFSPGDGTVFFAGSKTGYGKIVAIDHGYGLTTYYGHVASFYVQKGQRIKRGQRIATVGNTGRSTGPHVHYEVHANGTPIDPMYYVLDR